jgi:hypothetical protein
MAKHELISNGHPHVTQWRLTERTLLNAIDENLCPGSGIDLNNDIETGGRVGDDLIGN